jgi:hypothetical protein
MTILSPSRKRSRKCEAADPSKCRYHGNPDAKGAVTANTLMEEYAKQQKTSAPAAGNAVPVNSAVASSLNWESDLPSWWKKYEKELGSHPLSPIKPELLDVIDSPEGQLAVVWEKHSHVKGDLSAPFEEGMEINRCAYRSMKTGEVVGYVKMTHVNDETFEQSFGNDEFTAFRYLERFGGNSYGFSDYSRPRGTYGYDLKQYSGEELLEKRRETWLKYSQAEGKAAYVDGRYIASYNLGKEHVPDDATVEKDLKKFSKEVMEQKVEPFRTYFATPFVDYSNVDDSLKGKGFGAALYVYTARKLAIQGKALRGSGIQTEHAQSLWGKFKKKFPKNVKSMRLYNTHSGEPTDYYTLDFTQ